MRLLVTSALTADEQDLEVLRQLGHDVLFIRDERGALPAEAYDAQGVICNGLFLHHEAANFPHLRFVQVTSAGLDRVPSGELRARGVQLHNAKGVYSTPMAEWVVLQVLQLYKRARFFEANQAQHMWVKARDLRELAGRTACIVGFGEVGQAVAKRLRAFEVRIVAVDVTADSSPLADTVLPVSSLPDALHASDIVILTLPLTPETHHLMNEQMLRTLKPEAVLVNVSRGAVVDEPALIGVLEAGRLSGVALDVFEQEPLPSDSPLWGMDRVLVTPHNSFVSDRVQARLLALVVDQLTAV